MKIENTLKIKKKISSTLKNQSFILIKLLPRRLRISGAQKLQIYTLALNSRDSSIIYENCYHWKYENTLKIKKKFNSTLKNQNFILIKVLPRGLRVVGAKKLKIYTLVWLPFFPVICNSNQSVEISSSWYLQ